MRNLLNTLVSDFKLQITNWKYHWKTWFKA